MDSLFDQL